MKTLLRAHERKRISVYVTEAKPRGLGYVSVLSFRSRNMTHSYSDTESKHTKN